MYKKEKKKYTELIFRYLQSLLFFFLSFLDPPVWLILSLDLFSAFLLHIFCKYTYTQNELYNHGQPNYKYWVRKYLCFLSIYSIWKLPTQFLELIMVGSLHFHPDSFYHHSKYKTILACFPSIFCQCLSSYILLSQFRRLDPTITSPRIT